MRTHATPSRPQAARMYSVVPYAGAYFLAEVPYLLVNSLLATVVFFFMANLNAAPGNTGENFAWFWLFLLLAVTAMTFLGHALAVLLPSVKNAQTLASVTNSLFAIFGGG